MEQRQLDALIERVIARIREETAHTRILPQAYLILPLGWRARNQSRCIETLRALRGSYRPVAVLPDDDSSADALDAIGVSATVKRSEAVFPTEDFPTIFPLASRSLVVKTALCLQDDFETRWIAQCIALGKPVYMPRESPLFTGREPRAYRQKIESYYRDAEAYGILFDTLPPKQGGIHRANSPGPSQKKRIITAKDLAQPPPAKELRLRAGDIVTALAAERAEELGISILYQ